MKKVINILVSIVFLLSFVGVQIHKHYSNGKLYSVAVYTEAETCCADMDNCEMANTTSCHHQQKNDCSCEDETEIFQLNDNFFVSEKLKINEMPSFDIISNFCSFSVILTDNLLQANTIVNSLPQGKPINTQTEFGVFLC